MPLKKNQEKIEVDLLFEGQLRQFLERFGMYEKYRNNELRCDVCGNTITLDNLGLLKITNEQVKFICNSAECIRSAHAKSD